MTASINPLVILIPLSEFCNSLMGKAALEWPDNTASLNPLVILIPLAVGCWIGYCAGRLNKRRWKP